MYLLKRDEARDLLALVYGCRWLRHVGSEGGEGVAPTIGVWRLKLGNCMITVPELAAEALGSFLTTHMSCRFGSTDANLIEVIPSAARLALECIGNSDALYHNVEHTMLVMLVGHDIMKGRSLLTSTSASDYAHLIAACLFHDIGFVRGILTGDGEDGYVIDGGRQGKALARFI